MAPLMTVPLAAGLYAGGASLFDGGRLIGVVLENAVGVAGTLDGGGERAVNVVLVGSASVVYLDDREPLREIRRLKGFILLLSSNEWPYDELPSQKEFVRCM